jgi:hypothetical protein
MVTAVEPTLLVAAIERRDWNEEVIHSLPGDNSISKVDLEAPSPKFGAESKQTL